MTTIKVSVSKKIDKKWPHLFTCPTDIMGIESDDLGSTTFNPVFSNRGKMLNDSCEGCAGCDYNDAGECPGPVEYRPL